MGRGQNVDFNFNMLYDVIKVNCEPFAHPAGLGHQGVRSAAYTRGHDPEPGYHGT